MTLLSTSKLLKQYLSNMHANVVYADLSKVPGSWGNAEFVPDLHKFYFILDGEGTLTIDGVSYQPKPGQLFLLPAGVKQSLATDSDNTFYKYWCHFSATIGDASLFDVLKTGVYIEAGDQESISSLFRRMVDHYHSSDPLSAWQTQASLFELLYAFFRQAGIAEVKLEGSFSHEKVMAVVSYMELHMAETVTVDELAKLVHLHPNYFSQLFKNMLGLSPLQYLNRMRIEKAKSLLVHSLKSVTTISEEIGIELHYFSRLFKLQTGFAPSDYRKMHGRKR
ncbi:helix-turn-helix domain-containing protein [Paenibacillus sp. MBLB4367]|uniref:helix-turn-helix domain-containing protein n=1 Tax=Paenibacillus sp. MBLB4367 TaxID=3384767 RepID=UPI0039082A5B